MAIPRILLVILVCGIKPGENCCTQNKVSLDMTFVVENLQANSTVPDITQSKLWMDVDYGLMRRRSIGSLFENSSWTRLHYDFQDFNTEMTYKWYDETDCEGDQVKPQPGLFTGPCINSSFTDTKLDHSYKITSGGQEVLVNVYTGVLAGILRVTWHATAADCTPVYFTVYGREPNGAFTMITAKAEGVKQGSLRDEHALDLPAACQDVGQTGVIGK